MTYRSTTAASTEVARRGRIAALQMVAKARASHIGGCLSTADILAVLYSGVLRVRPDQPEWSERDRFILSKGHAAAILYAVLAEKGFIPEEILATYCADGAPLTGHVSHTVAGIEVATGSLGHGLPIGCGMALVAKREKLPWRTFVLMSDGELDEGSNWEAILFAGHHRLDGLIAIVDYNKIQSFGSTAKVLDLEPLRGKFESFRWTVREIDGHDHQALTSSLGSVPFETDSPSVLIAHTVKGKGVSFMENELAWHYKSPNPEELQKALAELGVPQ